MTGKTANLHPDLLALLEKVEQDVGVPLHVTSGQRDVEKNAAVGGVKGSEHTYAPAEGADVAATTGAARFEIVKMALLQGCVRIGIGKTFVHLGIAQDKPRRVLWLYT